MYKANIHPLSTIVLFIAFLIPSVIFSSPIYNIILLILINHFIIKFGAKQKLKYLLPMFLIYFIISLFVNFIFTNAGTTKIFQINHLPIIGGYKRLSLELILFTFTGTIRLLYIISIFNFISLISSEDRLMNFFSKFMKRFPLLLSFTIRLIPKLARDYKKLEHIFKLRGLNQNSDKKKKNKRQGLVRKIKSALNPSLMSALIRTLLMNSLEDSIQFAESMQSRGFGGKSKRSSFTNDKVRQIDCFLIITSIIYICCIFFLSSLSLGTKDIYPLFKLKNFINFDEILALLGIIIINYCIFFICFVDKLRTKC